jgi:hypothetical protein
MKALGIVLLVLGLIGIGYGGLSWTREDTIVDVGPIELSKEKTETFPIPPIAGAACLVAGVVLLLKGKG